MNSNNLSPIILFVYNRLDHTRKTVEALQKNELAKESTLYVFADGAKENATEEQRQKIKDVRDYIHTITGFDEIIIEEAVKNKGLANSVITGVSKVINEHGKVIVVEDDIVTHPFFLRFMNDCLEVYEQRGDIFSIAGNSQKVKMPKYYRQDIYLISRVCSWGWATWVDRWNQVDWNMSDYTEFSSSKSQIDKFNRAGNDLYPMLQMQMNGLIDSWAIRWQYELYRKNMYCVYPRHTFCSNTGFDGTGIHCGISNIKSRTASFPTSKNYDIKLEPYIKPSKAVERNYKMFQDRVNLMPIHKSIILRIKRLLHPLKVALMGRLDVGGGNNDQYYQCDPSTVKRNFNIRLDNPVSGRNYLTIGKDCIVSGNFIFESHGGRITIGNHSYIGGGMYISRSSIEIGNNVTIAWGGTVYDHDSHSLDYLDRRKDIDDELDDIRNGRNFIENKDWTNVNSKPIRICDDAWIGMNVIILKGVTIGEGAVVGAGSVVTKDVPAWCVAVGNPAKVVKKLRNAEG